LFDSDLKWLRFVRLLGFRYFGIDTGGNDDAAHSCARLEWPVERDAEPSSKLV
jgi:hypothetical protein